LNTLKHMGKKTCLICSQIAHKSGGPAKLKKRMGAHRPKGTQGNGLVKEAKKDLYEGKGPPETIRWSNLRKKKGSEAGCERKLIPRKVTGLRGVRKKPWRVGKGNRNE